MNAALIARKVFFAISNHTDKAKNITPIACANTPRLRIKALFIIVVLKFNFNLQKKEQLIK